MTDADDVEVLLSVPTEAEAALIVATLSKEGIVAAVEGALTSALRAEVPGEVRILVRRVDLDRAAAVLMQIEQDRGDVDRPDAP